jgi:hypothetical protein
MNLKKSRLFATSVTLLCIGLTHTAAAQSPSFSTVPNFGQGANDGTGQSGGVASGIFNKVPPGGSKNVLPGQPAIGSKVPSGAPGVGSANSGTLSQETDNLVKELMGRNGEGSSYAKTAIKNMQDVASSDFGN